MGMFHKVDKTWWRNNFYELKSEWGIHGVDYLVVYLGDINVIVGRHIDKLDGVHEGMV